MRSLREPLFEAGFGHYDRRFANGELANNKLDLGYDNITSPGNVRRHPGLRAEIIHRLGIFAAEYSPDLLIPVPTGANGYAYDLAAKRRIKCIELEKDPVTKRIYYDGDVEEMLSPYHRIAIVEDVPNNLTTTLKVIDVLGDVDKIKVVLGIFDRGNPATRPALPDDIALVSVVQEHIPAWLKADDPRWKYAA